jgi:hypothetical protein
VKIHTSGKCPRRRGNAASHQFDFRKMIGELDEYRAAPVLAQSERGACVAALRAVEVYGLRRGRLTESTLETGQDGLCTALKIDAYALG